MKKLLLTGLGVLAFSFSFANNSGSLVNSQSAQNDDCVNFTLSCGISGFACNMASTEELISEVLYFEEELC